MLVALSFQSLELIGETEITEWDPSPYYASPKDARRADLSEQFAVAAATENVYLAAGAR